MAKRGLVDGLRKFLHYVGGVMTADDSERIYSNLAGLVRRLRAKLERVLDVSDKLGTDRDRPTSGRHDGNAIGTSVLKTAPTDYKQGCVGIHNL